MFALTPYRRNTWSILDELDSLQEDMERAWCGNAERAFRPAVDVWSSEDGLTVQAELPGVDIKDIDIAVKGDHLTLRGKIEAEERKDTETVHRRERVTGEFVRTLQLPFKANAQAVKASYKNGVLTVAVPRSEDEKETKVAIKAA